MPGKGDPKYTDFVIVLVIESAAKDFDFAQCLLGTVGRFVDAEWGATENNRKARYYGLPSSFNPSLRSKTV